MELQCRSSSLKNAEAHRRELFTHLRAWLEEMRITETFSRTKELAVAISLSQLSGKTYCHQQESVQPQYSLLTCLQQAPPPILVDLPFPVTPASVPALWTPYPRRPVQTLSTPCILTQGLDYTCSDRRSHFESRPTHTL